MNFKKWIMPVKRKLWSREEFILSLNLYLKLPFGKLDARTPEVIHLANLLGRTPGSISMRLNNFASVDPYHQNRGIKGLDGGKDQVKPFWDEFINSKEDLLFESEKILAEKEKTSINDKFSETLSGTEGLQGVDKIREVKTRINQNVFRQIVMANYDFKCAITGIDIPDLLLASHIVPWSKNEEERLNPENGICLSPLYDRAYDKGYIGINENFEILLSPFLKKKIKSEYHSKHFSVIDGAKITMPKKYYPRKDFLAFHLNKIFRQ